MRPVTPTDTAVVLVTVAGVAVTKVPVAQVESVPQRNLAAVEVAPTASVPLSVAVVCIRSVAGSVVADTVFNKVTD